MRFYHTTNDSKNAEAIKNSVDPDQTASKKFEQ